jgi:hypothetical protein
MERSAVIDSSNTYRYSLSRIWKPQAPCLCFVMLNPSTADGETDDPTIRRCIGFADSWQYGSIEVVNLYAYRATNPKDLWKATFPIGPENDAYIRKAMHRSQCVVAAWGAGAKCRNRVWTVIRLINNAFCLAKTKDGHPHHPLRLPADIKPIPYCINGAITR